MRYYEVHALGLNTTDVRFDKHGVGWSYSSIVYADSLDAAEQLFRKDKRFRRTARQNGERWQNVPVVVGECPRNEFASDLTHDKPVSYRRSRFLKRVSA